MTQSQQSNNRKILPVGIQDFRTIRQENHYYVDKTQQIHQLVSQGRHYFLSRPRRFGKSLLLDTLHELFDCQEELFRGLAIHDKWDWSQKHPVVHLSFDSNYDEPEKIEDHILDQLEWIAEEAQLDIPSTARSGPGLLQDVLRRLHRAFGRPVVVLVDEYDKPILDVLDNPELAKTNRDYLKGFYGIIKGSARYVRFVFVTGISMFTKVNLFSGLNNLTNITLDPVYSTICGYTERDLDEVFAPELSGLDRNEIRRWYNGYSWLGEEKLYNPFDILLFFRRRQFKSFWFETGSPTFLVRMLAKQQINPMTLERRIASENLVSKFDVTDISIEALMFQTGYLTIVSEAWDGVQSIYTLDYPNFEVSQGLNHELLEHATRRGQEATDRGKELAKLLVDNDFDRFAEHLQAYLSGIPHHWYDASEIERFEAHYASMLYMVFRSIGLDIRAEDVSSHGRADMVVLHGGQVFVMEFKMTGGDSDEDIAGALDDAIVQINDRGYATKYRDRDEPIHLLALAFGGESRNLVGMQTQTLGE